MLFSDALQPIGLSLLTDLWHTGPTGANADVTGRGERNQGHEDQPANLLNILMIYQLDMRIMHKEVHIFGWKYMMLKANMYSPHANMRTSSVTNVILQININCSKVLSKQIQRNRIQFVRSTWRYLSLDRFLASSLPANPRYWYFTTIQKWSKNEKSSETEIRYCKLNCWPILIKIFPSIVFPYTSLNRSFYQSPTPY